VADSNSTPLVLHQRSPMSAPRPCIGDTVRYYVSGIEFPSAAIVLHNNMPKGDGSWSLNLLVFSKNGESSFVKDVPYFNARNGELVNQAIPTDTISRKIASIHEITYKIESSIRKYVEDATKGLTQTLKEKKNIDEHLLSIETNSADAQELFVEARRLVGHLLEAQATTEKAMAELLDANTAIKEAKRIESSRQRIAEHKQQKKEEKEAEAFIGHIVRLKSGGPDMTAMKIIKDKGIYCAYMVGNEMVVLNIPHCALDIVNKPPVPQQADSPMQGIETDQVTDNLPA